MYTKKDLAEKFGISENTVYNTLKVCKLDTAKHDYTDAEVNEVFAVARQLLNSGKTYKEVKEYFQTKNGRDDAEPIAEEEFDSEGFAANQATDASDAVSFAVAQTVADMVERSVKEVAPYIPALVVQSINRELNSGEIKEAFDRMRSHIKGNKGSGAAFLLQKMQQTPQLMPSEPLAMSLPPSSMESSTTSSESES